MSTKDVVSRSSWHTRVASCRIFKPLIPFQMKPEMLCKRYFLVTLRCRLKSSLTVLLITSAPSEIGQAIRKSLLVYSDRCFEMVSTRVVLEKKFLGVPGYVAKDVTRVEIFLNDLQRQALSVFVILVLINNSSCRSSSNGTY